MTTSAPERSYAATSRSSTVSSHSKMSGYSSTYAPSSVSPLGVWPLTSPGPTSPGQITNPPTLPSSSNTFVLPAGPPAFGTYVAPLSAPHFSSAIHVTRPATTPLPPQPAPRPSFASNSIPRTRPSDQG